MVPSDMTAVMLQMIKEMKEQQHVAQEMMREQQRVAQNMMHEQQRAAYERQRRFIAAILERRDGQTPTAP